MRKIIVFTCSLITAFASIIFSQFALAGSCFPELTPSYSQYLTKALVFVLVPTVLILFLINLAIIPVIIQRNKNFVTFPKMLLFIFIVTLLSLTLYCVIYLLNLPNVRLFQFTGGSQTGFLSSGKPLSFIIYNLLNPLILVPFSLSYILNSLLLKKFLKITINVNRMTILISLVMYPAFGVFIVLLLSKMYFQLYPFVGQMWLLCN